MLGPGDLTDGVHVLQEADEADRLGNVSPIKLLSTLQRDSGGYDSMTNITRLNQSRGCTALQDQVNRLFENTFTRDRSVRLTWQPGRHRWIIRNRERIGR
jgi:hypothetical protein